MVTTLAYDQLVQSKLKEREIKGNITSTKMTPEECQQEIAAIQDGAVSEFEEIPIRGTRPDGTEVTAIILQPKRRGRPPGSKNKPKVK